MKSQSSQSLEANQAPGGKSTPNGRTKPAHIKDAAGRPPPDGSQASEERYAGLFDLAPIAYVVCDQAGLITEINSTGAALLGYTPAALRNQPLRAHVLSKLESAYESHLKACKNSTEIVKTELCLRKRNGTEFPAQLLTRAVRQNDGLELRTMIVDHSQLATAQDALQEAKKQLEVRVTERTAELLRANQELEAQIAARSRLEAELLKVSEREKRHFGQDLHDETCQGLAGLSLLARVIAREIDGASPSVQQKITLLSDQLRNLVEQTRRIASGLNPVSLSGGLVPVLRELAARVELRLPCKLIADEALVLSDNESLAFYRIAQEAAANALRHANATKIEISLKQLRNGITLAIRDDGIGLDVDRVAAGAMGLDIMESRARSVGAEFIAERRRTRGTQVLCVLVRPRLFSPEQGAPPKNPQRRTE